MLRWSITCSSILRGSCVVSCSHEVVILQANLIIVFHLSALPLLRYFKSVICSVLSWGVDGGQGNRGALLSLSRTLIVDLRRPALRLSLVIVLIPQSSRCLVLIWLDLRIVCGHCWGFTVLIEHALLPINTNEIEGVIPVQTRSLVLRHQVLSHERVVKVVVQLLLRRFKPHIIETLFQWACILGVTKRFAGWAFANL